MKLRDCLATGGILLLIGLQVPAQAERREGGAADAMRKAQLMIRSLSAEKSSLQAEKEQLGAQVKTLEAKVTELESGLESTRDKLGSARKHQEKLLDRVKSDVDKYKSLLQKYEESQGQLRSAIQDNQLLVNAVQERESWVSQCGESNRKLYQAGLDLLELYKNKSVGDVIKDKEPLLGFGRVELETKAQDYRFRLQDLRITPFQPSTVTASSKAAN